MKAVILAGGRGSRLAEETSLVPKPLVEIGGFPVLWHIMKLYSAAGINDFIVCGGYKCHLIKEYFHKFFLLHCDVTFDLQARTSSIHKNSTDPWRVTVVDTGLETMTGGRIKRVREYVGEEVFCLAYGDVLADIDIKALLSAHVLYGKEATVTAVRPSSRFGMLTIGADNNVEMFVEKPTTQESHVSAGFFVFSPTIFDLIEDDTVPLEGAPIEALVSKGQLAAYRHDGFWQPMDTLRDRIILENLWATGEAPWVVW